MCIFCGHDMEDDMATHWLVDLLDGEIAVFPCCQSMADAITSQGYRAAVGRSLESVVAEIIGTNGEQ